jgi:hypothetical protein
LWKFSVTSTVKVAAASRQRRTATATGRAVFYLNRLHSKEWPTFLTLKPVQQQQQQILMPQQQKLRGILIVLLHG